LLEGKRIRRKPEREGVSENKKKRRRARRKRSDEEKDEKGKRKGEGGDKEEGAKQARPTNNYKNPKETDEFATTRKHQRYLDLTRPQVEQAFNVVLSFLQE
jgi:hypothetical protein